MYYCGQVGESDLFDCRHCPAHALREGITNYNLKLTSEIRIDAVSLYLKTVRVKSFIYGPFLFEHS